MYSPNINKDELMRTYRFAIYVRVSSERQEREGTIESQLDDIYQYMEKRYPWVRREDIKIYRDEGWSGTSLERPEMDNLRIDLRDNKWDVLICYDQDRIARDPYLQLTILEEIEKYGKVLDFCTTEAPQSGNEDSRMTFEIRGLMAKYERVRAIGRFRIGKLRKARSKNILLSVPPYGYDLIKRNTNPETGVLVESHIIINEREAKVVRMIFDWLGNGSMTLRQIAHRLTAEGIQPRRNKRGEWNTSTLGSLVRNTTYVGIAKYQTTQAVEPKKRTKIITGPIKNKRTSRKMRPKEEWIEIDVPAILNAPEERELFERAQKQLVKNASLSPRVKVNQYLLGGVIRCECGMARTGEGPKEGRYLYYRCGSRNGHRHKGSRCPHEAVNARIADAVVWKKLKKMITDKKFLQQQYELYRSRMGSGEERQLKAVQTEIELLDGQMTDLKDAFVNSKISVHDFTELKEGVMAKRLTLEKRLAEVKGKMQIEESPIPEKYFDKIVSITSARLSDLRFEEKRGIVVRLVDNIVAIPGSLVVTGRVGIGSLSPQRITISQEDYSSNSLQNHVEHKTLSRNRWSSQCRKINLI